MPCRVDDEPDPVPSAALCALMRALIGSGSLEQALSYINWKEAGISEDQLHRWWTEHKRHDGKRRW